MSFLTDGVTDISPVRALTDLKVLHCQGSPAGKSKLTDLSPLKGMKLTFLIRVGAQVADLSPLKGMPLTQLVCRGTKVADLSPLKGMSLQSLDCRHTPVEDLSALRGMPLETLSCDFNPERDFKLLRSLTTLKTINDKPAREFWKEVEAARP